jgi:hypothetical protein
MQRGPDNVFLQHKVADDSGDVGNLYDIDDVPAELAQDFRERFAAAATPEAESALRHMNASQQADWDAASRDAWVRFLLSLLFRNPCTVAQVQAGIREILEAGARELRSRYANRRSDPKTFADYVTKANPQAPALAAANYLQNAMKGEAIADAINKMRWARIAVPRSRFSLLTSDSPLDMPLSLSDKNAYIALPLSPKALFIATNNSSLLESLTRQDHSKIVRMLNLATVTQARDYVWAADDSQYTFVKNHFGSAPVKALLSDRARQTALAALENRSGP